MKHRLELKWIHGYMYKYISFSNFEKEKALFFSSPRARAITSDEKPRDIAPPK